VKQIISQVCQKVGEGIAENSALLERGD